MEYKDKFMNPEKHINPSRYMLKECYRIQKFMNTNEKRAKKARKAYYGSFMKNARVKATASVKSVIESTAVKNI